MFVEAHCASLDFLWQYRITPNDGSEGYEEFH